MKKALKIILIVILVLVVLVAALLIWLSVTALNPETEAAVLTPDAQSDAAYAPGDTISVLSWNTGYAALGEESDFFMDGGEQTRPESENIIRKNLDGIISRISQTGADFTFLQEVDSGSTRSYGVLETEEIQTALGQTSAYARNYQCSFVPYPMPPIGKVSSGVLTLSTAPIGAAERVALPSPFKWPVSTANLKRCLLVSYVDLEGTDKQLVLVNLHLEAYDDGEGKAAQTKMLNEFIQSEYEKGNYVIAGGDFNQTFPGALEQYPIKNEELWTPGMLDDSIAEHGRNARRRVCLFRPQPGAAERDSGKLKKSSIRTGWRIFCIFARNPPQHASERADSFSRFSSTKPKRWFGFERKKAGADMEFSASAGNGMEQALSDAVYTSCSILSTMALSHGPSISSMRPSSHALAMAGSMGSFAIRSMPFCPATSSM